MAPSAVNIKSCRADIIPLRSLNDALSRNITEDDTATWYPTRIDYYEANVNRNVFRISIKIHLRAERRLTEADRLVLPKASEASPFHWSLMRPARSYPLQQTLFVAVSFLVVRFAEHFHPHAPNRHEDVIILAVCGNRVSVSH